MFADKVSRFFVNRYLLAYLLFALLLAPTHLLSLDTYYYWDWSRHLALSYYDGSPMIAYFIKGATLLFGDSLFALNLVGIVTATTTSVVLYKTARFFLNKEASYVAMLLWLLSPLVTLDILNQTTYDTPLTLFWAITLYFVMRYIKFNRIIDLYWIGGSIGLMILSKYSGVVLVLALIIFLLTSPYRRLFQSIHLYLAFGLAIVLASPVLISNYQHHWQSFVYQLNVHQLQNSLNPLHNIVYSLVTVFLPALNFLLIPPLIYFFKSKRRHDISLYLCLIICMTYLSFYLLIAGNTKIRVFWLGQYVMTASLLAGYYFQAWGYRKTILTLIVMYAVISLPILCWNTTLFSFTFSKKLTEYRWLQALNNTQSERFNNVVTSGWFEARMLFFLKNKPVIYTLDCGSLQNQYALWSADYAKAVLNKTIHSALYIDIYDRHHCMEKYFNNCQPIPVAPPRNQEGTPLIYAYYCTT